MKNRTTYIIFSMVAALLLVFNIFNCERQQQTLSELRDELRDRNILDNVWLGSGGLWGDNIKDSIYKLQDKVYGIENYLNIELQDTGPKYIIKTDTETKDCGK